MFKGDRLDVEQATLAELEFYLINLNRKIAHQISLIDVHHVNVLLNLF